MLDGKVIGCCMQRHRHQEYIRFLNTIEASVPTGKRIHAIVDNYATQKHLNVRKWLSRHRRSPRFARLGSIKSKSGSRFSNHGRRVVLPSLPAESCSSTSMPLLKPAISTPHPSSEPKRASIFKVAASAN